nr:hypothetical protein [Tanacetum cinerariifolium]
MLIPFKDVIRSDLRLDDADGVECLPNEEIFAELARMGYTKPPPKLTFTRHSFLHNGSRKFNFSKVGKGFSRVKTPLFASMLVQPQLQAVEEGEETEVPIASALPSPTTASSPSQDPTPTPHVTPHASPPQEPPTTTSESSMPLS